MRLKLIFVVFLMPFVLFSQKGRVITIEAGTTMFVPFEKHSVSGEGVITNANRFTFYTTASSFVKLGLEKTIVSKNHFFFSFPFAISYKEQEFKYFEEGLVALPMGPMACYVSYAKGSRKVETNSTQIGLISGPKFRYDFDKWSVFSSLNINYDFTIAWQQNIETHCPNFENSSYRYGNEKLGFFRLFHNLSSQNGLSYKLNDQVNIGLSCDMYFLNMNVFNPYSRKYQHFFNSNFGADQFYPLGNSTPHTVSSIINTGLQIQYKF